MNKIIEFIKRLFGRKQPLLNEKKSKKRCYSKKSKRRFYK